MLKIRLFRTGRKGRPSYRIVVADARAKRDGRYVESLGTYDPLTSPHTLKFNKERVDYWVSCGAQPTTSVRRLLGLGLN